MSAAILKLNEGVDSVVISLVFGALMCFSTVLCMSSVATHGCTLINCIMRMWVCQRVTLCHWVSRVWHCKRALFMDHWTLKAEGSAFLLNVRSHLTSDVASHLRRLEFSVSLLLKPQISCILFGEWSGMYLIWVWGFSCDRGWWYGLVGYAEIQIQRSVYSPTALSLAKIMYQW